MWQRKCIDIGGRKLSYLDNGASGPILVCLHGHFGCASMFTFLQSVHQGRLLLLDQRGHGESDRAPDYAMASYVQDLEHLLRHEKIESPILLGHSLGGVVVYCYAAQHPEVKGLIIEDIGTEVDCSAEFILHLPNCFDSLYELDAAL